MASKIIKRAIGTCRHSVPANAGHLRACGEPATSVRVIVRRYTEEVVFECAVHSTLDAEEN